MTLLKWTLGVSAAVLCLIGAALGGGRFEYLFMKQLDPQHVVSVIEIGHCANLVGVVIVTRDGTPHNAAGMPLADIMKLESSLPPAASTRENIIGDCDTHT